MEVKKKEHFLMFHWSHQQSLWPFFKVYDDELTCYKPRVGCWHSQQTANIPRAAVTWEMSWQSLKIFFLKAWKIKNQSRKIQFPDDFIIFASDFVPDFAAEKTLGEIAAFLEGCWNRSGSRQAFGRNLQTLSIVFDPVPKQIAGLRCEGRADRWRCPEVTIAAWHDVESCKTR